MLKVMIVEDEAAIRKGLKSLVEEVIGGFTVVAEAGDGKEALQIIERVLPDLLVTDIRMGQMNGIEMIKRIRDNHPELPIVIISGYADFEYAKQALKYRVTDYILKPVDRVELAQILKRLKKEIDDVKVEKKQKAAINQNIDVINAGREERQIIRKVKELVNEKLGDELSLQYIADQVHLNHQYLSYLFKTETGCNFSDYVTNARMENAKKLLKETSLKIYEVANMCGYSNSKHFMLVFKQLVGITPTEYREK